MKKNITAKIKIIKDNIITIISSLYKNLKNENFFASFSINDITISTSSCSNFPKRVFGLNFLFIFPLHLEI